MLDLPFYIGEHVIARLKPRLGRGEPLNCHFRRNATHALARTYRAPLHEHSAHMVGKRHVYGSIHAEGMNVVAWHEYRKRRIAGRRPRQKPAKALGKRREDCRFHAITPAR